MPLTARALASAPAAEIAAIRERFVARAAEHELVAPEPAVELATAVGCVYPALSREVAANPSELIGIAAEGIKHARTERWYRRQLALATSAPLDEPEFLRALRRFSAKEKLRIAVRELVSGVDVDATSRELAALASACIDVALSRALRWADERFGLPLQSNGERCPFVVLGMGKLGGKELNAGSDVDLLLFYETDEGSVRTEEGKGEETLHEYFTRTTQKMVSYIEDVTGDGCVWRVDLRLRPEGSRGPLVNALAAAERYYETWGRTWERAALLRARPIAGDLAFGDRVLQALGPFVWRRRVDPGIADEMFGLVLRARNELGHPAERDLKLGAGGIREVEFFAQSLQLIWGGRDPAVRTTNTLDALRKLRARGLVTDREGREMADAYLSLRRLEHRVQFATGFQTHVLPEGELTERIARSLGFPNANALESDLDGTRRRVHARFRSLTQHGRDLASEARHSLEALFVALESGDEAAVRNVFPPPLAAAGSPDLARHMIALARRPDSPFGANTRDKYPELGPVLVEALGDAADPEQAARLTAGLFGRLAAPSIYVRALAEDPLRARRLASLFGASAFLGEALVGHPELVDSLLFARGAPSAESSKRSVEEEVAALGADADADEFVGALRRAKGRVLVEVGLADLAGEIGTRDTLLALTALADAILCQATRFALEERGLSEAGGLAVIAMGKLGGRELGYGSDLDVFFVYEGSDDEERQAQFVRTAQRVLRLVSTPHGDGPGYELDTRLRPSGNQGLLVVSLPAFERYHALEGRAADWERQALIKARFCAGDGALGARVIQVAETVAYERSAPPADRLHHLRMRMQRELAGERGRELESVPPGTTRPKVRYDLKLGRGGLVDVEFVVQWLQMVHGRDPRVRTSETECALDALEGAGYLDAGRAAALREGYRWLRRLEQRLRVLHGTSATFIEDDAPGLLPLARRMGMRDAPMTTATEALLARYRAITHEIRATYLSLLGLEG